MPDGAVAKTPAAASDPSETAPTSRTISDSGSRRSPQSTAAAATASGSAARVPNRAAPASTPIALTENEP